ncbi:histidine kinase [Streptomyces sp. NPDC052101]|uniref:sensor histidine kinase n=1 Tax=Streptomyces sp. NPDC052101 TaxID=3155763 RepID=UPI0034184531
MSQTHGVRLTGSVTGMTAAAVVVAAISVLRRVLPASVLVLAGAMVGVLGGTWSPVIPLLMVAGWSAGARIEPWRRVLSAFITSFVLYAVLCVEQEAPGVSALVTLLNATPTFLAAAVVPGLVGRYRAQRRRLLSALHEHNAQLLRERELIASHTRMRERQRIAQDMHDSLGHQLTLIAVHAGALEVDPGLAEGQREAVGVLRDASTAAMHELREAVGILRDGTPTQHTESERCPRAAAWRESTVWWRRPGSRGRAWSCCGTSRMRSWSRWSTGRGLRWPPAGSGLR